MSLAVPARSHTSCCISMVYRAQLLTHVDRVLNALRRLSPTGGGRIKSAWEGPCHCEATIMHCNWMVAQLPTRAPAYLEWSRMRVQRKRVL